MRIDRLLNALRHPYTEYQVTKAKRKYRKAHPCSELSGLKSTFFGRNLDVHHVIPVHVNPALACDQSNLITLTRKEHFVVGHLGNWKDYNVNMRNTVYGLQITMINYARSGLIEKRLRSDQ